MKKLMMGVVMLLMLGGVAGAVTTDSVLLIVSPVFNLSVNIVNSSATFGALDIGSSKTILVGQVWNDGNITSGKDQPCQGACKSREYTAVHVPGLFTRSIEAIVAPRKTSKDIRRSCSGRSRAASAAV